jgi:hypothetical protein
MPRKPSPLQQEAFRLYVALLWDIQAYWDDYDPNTPPTHYVLERELWERLLTLLKSTAGRAYPRSWKPFSPMFRRRRASRGRLEQYEALCREFAERGEKAPANRALEVMAKNEKQRAALEKTLYRERKERERSQELLRKILS